MEPSSNGPPPPTLFGVDPKQEAFLVNSFERQFVCVQHQTIGCLFNSNGVFLDYLTMKIWDPRMEAHALRTIKFHDRIMPNLCDLYEDDSIFDKFTCAWSGMSSLLQQVPFSSYRMRTQFLDIYIICPPGSGRVPVSPLLASLWGLRFDLYFFY